MKNLLKNTESQRHFEGLKLSNFFTKECTDAQLPKMVHSERTQDILDNQGEAQGQRTIVISLDPENNAIEVYQVSTLQEVNYINLYTLDIDDILDKVGEEGTMRVSANDFTISCIIEALHAEGCKFKENTFNDKCTFSTWLESNDYRYCLKYYLDTHNSYIEFYNYAKIEAPEENIEDIPTASSFIEDL